MIKRSYAITGMSFSFACSRTVPRESPSMDAITRHLASGVDHVLDLGYLRRNVVGCILQIHFIACFLQLGLHVGTILVPSLQILGGHCYTDLTAACCTSGAGMSLLLRKSPSFASADVSVLLSVAGVDACCPPLDPHPASIVTAMAVARSVLNNFFLIKSNLPCLVCFCC